MWAWVKEHLGLENARGGRFYVYKLIDPRYTPPRVFYVGKGTGNRMYQHEKDMRKYLVQGRAGIMRLQPKHKRILEIVNDGYAVVYDIGFRTDNEEEAYQVESKLINDIGLENLTNETYGYNTKAVRARRAARRR